MRRAYRGDEQHRVAILDNYGTICLFGDSARLDRQFFIA
jgi:hypothetical protein